MLKLMFAALTVLCMLGQDALAHHSWKCPPATKVQVKGIGTNNRFELLVEATNTCGCKVHMRACPSDDKNNCTKKWLKPGETWRFTIMSGSADGKANFDWGTHSNEAPCSG